MSAQRTVIAPRAIAYIRDHGPQTIVSLCKGLRYRNYCCVARALLDAVDAGLMLVVERERTGVAGRPTLHYGLPNAVEYPKLTAGEYCGWMPTGTVPSDVRRLSV